MHTKIIFLSLIHLHYLTLTTCIQVWTLRVFLLSVLVNVDLRVVLVRSVDSGGTTSRNTFTPVSAPSEISKWITLVVVPLFLYIIGGGWGGHASDAPAVNRSALTQSLKPTDSLSNNFISYPVYGGLKPFRLGIHHHPA